MAQQRLQPGDTTKRKRKKFAKDQSQIPKDVERFPATRDSEGSVLKNRPPRTPKTITDRIPKTPDRIEEMKRRGLGTVSNASPSSRPKLPKLSTASESKPSADKARTATKGPSDGQMAYTPPKGAESTSRGSGVTSTAEPGAQRQITNVISGQEAIRRAKTQAEKKRLEFSFYGRGGPT